MKLHINTASETPIYRQLYDRLTAAILSGELKGGEALPPIRTVASELKISVIGVRRAWEELDRDGYISSEVGRGSFVCELNEEEREQRCKEQLRTALAPALQRCRELRLPKETVLSLISDMQKETGTADPC